MKSYKLQHESHTKMNTQFPILFLFLHPMHAGQTSKKHDPRKPLSRFTAQATDQKCMLMFVSGIMDLDCLNWWINSKIERHCIIV